MSKTKKPGSSAAEKYPRKAIPCESGPSIDEQGRSYAKLITSAELAACRVIAIMQPKSLSADIDNPTLIAILRDQAVAVQNGDLAYAEAMLINQSSALQALFVRLSEKAMEQTHMPNLEAFMRLALRAQSQCRATLETLSAVKHPPIVYAQQANVTSGPQQINNGTATPKRTREIKSKRTQLSGGSYDLLSDTRTPGYAGRIDPTLEALGEIDRAEVLRGEGEIRKTRLQRRNASTTA